MLPGITSVGNETNMALWTQVATGSGTGAGTEKSDHVMLSNPFVLNAGTFYGIAVVAHPAISLFYTNGINRSNVFRCRPGLVLGSATNVPFTARVFTPRVWNGTIYYTGGPLRRQSNSNCNTYSDGQLHAKFARADRRPRYRRAYAVAE